MTCQNCGTTKKPFITGLGEDIEAATCPDCGAYDIIPSNNDKATEKAEP